MKKIIIVSLVCFWHIVLSAQTVLTGKQAIEKNNFEGLYVTTEIAEKHLSKYWGMYLKQYGKVNSARSGVCRLPEASILSISSSPVNLVSRVSSSNGGSQVFVHLDLGGGTYVCQGTKGYEGAKVFLKKFVDYALLLEEARIAEDAMQEAEKNFNKLSRKRETLQRDIIKTEEKLVQLKKDLENNQTDAANAQADLKFKTKVFETAKMKVPEK